MTKRALVIDDSNSMRRMLALTLQSAGFTVDQGANGQEALDALTASGPYDVIITDLNMPVMDGLEFIRKARHLPTSRRTPILMLTTENSPEKKAQGKAAGATGWIVKPFQPDQLVNVVHKVVPA